MVIIRQRSADIVVIGDGDLLALNPFQGIAIVTPAQFLELQSS
jgi:predicted nucleic acid-binding protein